MNAGNNNYRGCKQREIDTTGKVITKIRKFHRDIRKEDNPENKTDTEGKKILEKQRLKYLW